MDDDSDDDLDEDDDSDDDLNLHEDCEDSEAKFKSKFYEVQEAMTKVFSNLPEVPHAHPIYSNMASKPNDKESERNHQNPNILLRCFNCEKNYKTQGGLSRHIETKHR